MEKTIKIDGQDIRLKSTAATPIRYKTQFKKDYFSELLKLAKTFDFIKLNENGEVNVSEMSDEAIVRFDLEPLYNFVWVLAKSADSSIPEPLEWLDGFDAFPLQEVFGQVTELLGHSIQSNVKK